jgi:hypothetical protein
MFSASELAFLAPIRYRLLCILPAISLLLVGLVLVNAGAQWQRIKVDGQIQRQADLNQLLRQELQQIARMRLSQLPMLQSVIAIDGVDQKFAYGGQLLAGLRDLAMESGLKLQTIAETAQPDSDGSLLRLDLFGEPGQLTAYIRLLSAHITSLQGFNLKVSGNPELNNQQEITLLLPPQIVRLMQAGQAALPSAASQLGLLSVDGESWHVVRGKDGKLRLQKRDNYEVKTH